MPSGMDIIITSGRLHRHLYTGRRSPPDLVLKRPA
jgi:hypothetical protein